MTARLTAIRPKRLQLVDPHMTVRNISHGTEAYLNSVKKKLQFDYSRVTPSPKYSRTRTLYGNWEVSVSPDGSTGVLSNATPWAVYAQGPRAGNRGSGARQAAHMRARGWRSISDVARETKKDYVEVVNRSLKGSSVINFHV